MTTVPIDTTASRRGVQLRDAVDRTLVSGTSASRHRAATTHDPSPPVWEHASGVKSAGRIER